jgi:hypothetical protein
MTIAGSPSNALETSLFGAVLFSFYTHAETNGYTKFMGGLPRRLAGKDLYYTRQGLCLHDFLFPGSFLATFSSP